MQSANIWKEVQQIVLDIASYTADIRQQMTDAEREQLDQMTETKRELIVLILAMLDELGLIDHTENGR